MDRARSRRPARVRRPDDPLGGGPLRAARTRSRRPTTARAWTTVREVAPGRRRPRRPLPSRVGVALRPASLARARRTRRLRRSGDRRPAARLSANRPTRSSRRSRATLPGARIRASFSGEQSYWTVVGVSGDTECALVLRGRRRRARDGRVLRRAVSLRGRAALLTWADVRDDARARRGRPADPAASRRRARRADARRHGGRLRRPGARVGPRPLSRLATRAPTRRTREALPRRSPVPGQPALAVPEPARAASRRSESLAWDGRAVSVDGGSPRSSRRLSVGVRRRLRSTTGPITGFSRARDRLPPSARTRRRASATPPARSPSTSISPPGGVRRGLDRASDSPGAPRLSSAPMPRADGAALSHRQPARGRAAWRAAARPRRFSGPAGGAGALPDRCARTSRDILIERDGPALRPGHARRTRAPGSATAR